MFLLRIFAGLLAVSAIAASAGADPVPRVVVTSKPIHALVATVMAGVGVPDLLVEGAASPHTYALKPSDARRVNQAGVFFRVSEALEPFTGRLVKSLPKTTAVVTLAEAPGVQLLSRRGGGTFEVRRHAHAHGHSHGGTGGASYDAHVWLDPVNAKAMVARIVQALSAAAPASGPRFAANGAQLSAKLDALSVTLAKELAGVSDRPFVVLHDAYQYFEKRFGLSAIGSILVDPDEQPSAKRLSDLRRRVGSLSAVCVFAEPNHQPRVVASVVEGTSARTAVLDPEGTAIDAGPDLYFELMQSLAKAMKSCLAQG